MTSFSEISASYNKNALVQQSASDILLKMLNIGPGDDVLDVGCGTGTLLKRLRQYTAGRLVGIDPSAGMIEKAQKDGSKHGISFYLATAEEFSLDTGFDAIFCNSAFQWFKNPVAAVASCRRAMKPGARMAIQAPARHDYSPNFLQAAEKLQNAPETREIFSTFTPPWFFLDSPKEYADVFQQGGLAVKEARIDKVVSEYPAEKVFEIFCSGAAAGYFNQAYYGMKMDETYLDAAKEVVHHAFLEQADERGVIELLFYRIYLLAENTNPV